MQHINVKFNASALKTKGLSLLIGHGPCCGLSFVAGLMAIPGFSHNPLIELCFALGGAAAGEYVGHKYFVKEHAHKSGWKPTAKRYGLSLLFGLAAWGVHQAVFHNHDHDHDHATEHHQHTTDKCHDHDHNEIMSFWPAQLTKRIDEAHKATYHQNCPR